MILVGRMRVADPEPVRTGASDARLGWTDPQSVAPAHFRGMCPRLLSIVGWYPWARSTPKVWLTADHWPQRSVRQTRLYECSAPTGYW